MNTQKIIEAEFWQNAYYAVLFKLQTVMEWVNRMECECKPSCHGNCEISLNRRTMEDIFKVLELPKT
jgi:hypothetical protein